MGTGERMMNSPDSKLEAASLMGYDWCEEAQHTSKDAASSDMAVPDPSTLPKFTISQSQFLAMKLVQDHPTHCALMAVSVLLMARILLDTLSAMYQMGCGYYSVLTGAFFLFGIEPLVGLCLTKVYMYRVAQYYRVAESSTQLARQRMFVSMNVSNFSCFAMLPWFAMCYSLSAGPSDSPIEPYLCMYDKQGHEQYLGGQPFFGSAKSTVWCLIVLVPMVIFIMMNTRDLKEDAAKAAAQRAKGG